jgi:hypothetical protein
VKYLVSWEFHPEDMEKVFNKFGEYMKDHEKNPGKYQEYLYPSHGFAGQSKGFSLVEATPEQINNVIIDWTPLMKLKYNPIVEASKLVEQFMKSK